MNEDTQIEILKFTLRVIRRDIEEIKIKIIGYLEKKNEYERIADQLEATIKSME